MCSLYFLIVCVHAMCMHIVHEDLMSMCKMEINTMYL
jgi:hypothetical protein